MTRLSEEQLAAAVVTWLREQHWEVYQEVTVRSGPRCDIVATQGPLLWAIECKVSLGLAVLCQALRWPGQANLVSVATGWPGASRESTHLVRTLGIGALRVTDRDPDGGPRVTELVAAPLNRRVAPVLRDCLREEHKTFAPAGNADSHYWSPWKATCRAVQDFVRGRPGRPMREVVDGISHHYASPASARNHLARWIEAGKIPGVMLRRDGRRVFVEATS